MHAQEQQQYGNGDNDNDDGDKKMEECDSAQDDEDVGSTDGSL